MCISSGMERTFMRRVFGMSGGQSAELIWRSSTRLETFYVRGLGDPAQFWGHACEDFVQDFVRWL